MRYCEIYDPVKLGRITMRDYQLMMKAVNYKLVDKQRDLHVQAWLNVQAKATKQKGKKTVPYFKSFAEFFKDPIEEQKKKSARNAQMDSGLRKLLLKANSGN